MRKAQSGDTVKVHYTGTLKTGEKFDSSEGRDPLQFKIGEGQLLKKFEESVVGLEVGEKADVEMSPAEGYGEKQLELIGDIPLERLPEGLTPEVGMKLQSQAPNGQPIIITVTAVAEDKITVDANHELAGKDLKFEIELVEISE